MYARRVLTLVMAFVATAYAAESPGTPPQRAVLTIHWGAEEFPGTAALDQAIRAVLQSSSDAPLQYYSEYLESETFPSSPPLLRDYIRRKYNGRGIGVVIASTTAALEFAANNRDTLFPGVPIVFGASSIPAAIRDGKVSGITGVVSNVSIPETLELVLRLHPSVKRVFVVAQATGSNAYIEGVQAALREYSQRVELTYIREASVPGLLAAIKAIPRESVILYTRYAPLDPSSVRHPVAVAQLLAQASPVPIYSTSGQYLGTGVVGGMMRENGETGTRLGQIALQILEGAPPEDIPVEEVRSRPTFDWRQLQRWGIDPSRLPPGSDIHYRTPTAWEYYRSYIASALAVMVVQMLLIVGLLTQRARRRRAEEAIRDSEAALRRSYERSRQLAGRLIHEQETARVGIARDLHDDVCQQLAFVSVGVDRLKRSSGSLQDQQTQQAFMDLERETMRVFDGIRRLSHDLHPASLQLLGLAPALKAHCREVEDRHGVRVSFRAEGDLGSLHPELAVCLYRIAQEALRNGLVHGRAGRFVVSLTRFGGWVELTVADDGRGFDLEAVRRNGHGLGLVSMEERAHVVDAEVRIITSPGQGTTIRVSGHADHPADLPGAVPVNFAG